MNTNTCLQALKRSALALIPVIALTSLIATGSGSGVEPKAPAKATGKGKLYHTGYIWLKEPGNKAHQQAIIDAAHRFAAEIPEVQNLAVGKSVPKNASPLMDTSFDVSLTMQFEDQAAMDRYAKHPVHEKAAHEVFLPLSQKILFYDFIAE
jgi:hypothetical protein